MATFKNYQPRSEGLNAAYEMLLQAELAKAQAMGNAFAPLTDAIRSGQQMKIARDEQARLTKSQAEDNALRTQRMGLDTRELDLREKQLNRAMSQDEAFARALTLFPEHTPAASGVPFTGGGSAAMTQRPPLSAGGLLGQPQPQMDPGALAAMGGENASRYIGIQNTLADNQRADAKIAYDQQQETSEQKAYADYLKGLEKELPPEQIPGYKARMGTKEGRNAAYAEIGKYMGEKGKAARENTEFDTYRTNQIKEWKKAYGSDPKKMGEVADIELWSKGLPGTPEEKRKAWDDRAEKLMGIGKEEKPDPGVDLPNIGQNLTLNTSLDRRKSGGQYTINNGEVVGLSDAEAGELNSLVRAATSRDRLFDDSLMMVLAGDKLPPEYQKNLDRARDVERAKIRKDILDQLGWKQGGKDPLSGMGGSKAVDAEARPDASESGVNRLLAEAIKSGEVKDGDYESIRSFLAKTFTEDELKGGNAAAAKEYRQSATASAVAKGKGHTQDMSTSQIPADEASARQAVETAKTLMGTYRDPKTEDALRAKARYDLLRSLYKQKFGKDI